MAEGLAGNEDVVRPYWLPLTRQIGTNSSGHFGIILIKGQNLNRSGKKIMQPVRIALNFCTFVRAVPEFKENDGRDADQSVCLMNGRQTSMHLLRFTIQKRDARVRIKQIAHEKISSRF